ncbi:1170_t:CDS:1 [Ambispora gerdemannii]|uniref:1170_t:CDS:1 n=1 Tax=Ambispora gerdemannii TaxID=144530 RepID=A0A9N9AC34_9GLOM|nr:1170_t:CDS:1 [Ambispora gerdemannii]
MHPKLDTKRLSIDEIDVPFPLTDQLDSVIARYTKKINGKLPNSFILYRKAFNNELSSNGYYLQAKEVSSIASKKWKAKSNLVKEEYQKVAKRISKMVEEIEPNRTISYKRNKKSNRRNKRPERVQKFPISLDTSIINSDSEESNPTTPYYCLQQNQSNTFHGSQLLLKNQSEYFPQIFNFDTEAELYSSSSFVTRTLTHTEQTDDSFTELLLSLMNWESEEYFINFPATNHDIQYDSSSGYY